MEEMWWFQRSRVLWLKDGDRNTSFFHTKASQRRRRNTIHRIKDGEGIWARDSEGIGKVLTDYFKDLFTSVNQRHLHHVIESIESRVICEMNDMLNQPYTAGEIAKALKQMHPVKATGPDGMPPLFFPEILAHC
ncbi:hypothetical protein ACS0TY_030301 [Phlomoides rotata]